MQSCHRAILQESKCKYNVYLPEKLEEASKLLYPSLLFVILALFRPYSHQRFYCLPWWRRTDSPKERETFTSFADSRRAIGEGMVSNIYPLPLPHLHSNHVLQYGAWKVDMDTTPAPICFNTKSTMFFSFLANVQSLAAHCNGHNGGTKTHKTFQNVMKDLEETVKLSLPSQTPWARKWTWGEGAGGKNLPCKMTPFPASWVVLSTIWSVLAEKQKLIAI